MLCKQTSSGVTTKDHDHNSNVQGGDVGQHLKTAMSMWSYGGYPLEKRCDFSLLNETRKADE